MKAILLIALVATLRATSAAARIGPTSPLDGQWTFTWTLAELKRANAQTRYAGHHLVELRNGRLISVLPRSLRVHARFTTSGNVATVVFPAPAPAGVIARKPYVMRWSIYRDRLSWSAVPGRAFIGMFVAVPWTRVR